MNCSVSLHLFHKTGKTHVLLQKKNSVIICWPKVGLMLFSQQHKPFLLAKKNGVGQRLARCWSTNQSNFNSEILYVGPTLALRCKANTIKCVAFQISSNTCWCWPNIGPTLCTQRQPSANSITVCQRWPNVVMLSGIYTYCSYQQIIQTVRYCFHYRKMPVEKVSRIENQFIQLSSFSTFGVIWK